jgi:hypothetical protein
VCFVLHAALMLQAQNFVLGKWKSLCTFFVECIKREKRVIRSQKGQREIVCSEKRRHNIVDGWSM